LADLDRHHFEIECRIDNPAPEQRFSLPAWIPGSYLLRDFARFVVSIAASSGRQALPLEKVESGTWLARGAEGELAVTATIYALDQSVRGAYLDRRRGFFNGPCVFLLPEGRDHEAVEVTLELPQNPICEGWRVATALKPVDVNEQGFGRYAAADYDELLDHPVEMSDFESVEFEAGGVPHHLVVAAFIPSTGCGSSVPQELERAGSVAVARRLVAVGRVDQSLRRPARAHGGGARADRDRELAVRRSRGIAARG
jgi:predicted metalloprotease with PDZ domain